MAQHLLDFEANVYWCRRSEDGNEAPDQGERPGMELVPEAERLLMVRSSELHWGLKSLS